MAMTHRWLFAAVLPFIPLQAHAQALWHGTSFGMSVDEVRQAVHGAAKFADPAEQLSDGSAALLKLERTRIDGKMYAARFYFAQRRLVQVTLSLVGDHDPDAVQRQFDAVSHDLRVQYGEETRHETQTCQDAMERMEFVSGATKVDVREAADGAKPHEILDIEYQVAGS